MKKILTALLLIVFLGGVLVFYLKSDNSDTKTEMVKKQVPDLVAAEAIQAPEAIFVEYAVYYPPVTEAAISTGGKLRAVANSPPDRSKTGKERIRADT